MEIDKNLSINADLETILQRLQDDLQDRGIPYLQKTRDSGNNIMVQCPYHGNGQERKPSAGIHKETGILHCFACGETHSLPEVISYCFGHPDDIFGKYGLQWLVSNFMTVTKEERKGIEFPATRNSPHVEATNSPDNFVTETELDSYRYYHQYWTDRGITDEEIIELFDLGYDQRTDCITFPVRNADGDCLFVARRSVKTKWFNYPQDVEKPLYGVYELKKTNVAIHKLFITESMIDCILLWQAGIPAVALNGTGSDLQFYQLTTLPWRHYVLATDNDKAGEDARNKLKRHLRYKLFTEINFPEGIKDVGDLGKAKRFQDIRNIERWEVF